MTHPQNCGTCINKEAIPTPRWASETPLRLGERCKITKQKCKKKFTSSVGCASWGKGVVKGSNGQPDKIQSTKEIEREVLDRKFGDLMNGQLQRPIPNDEQCRICSQFEQNKVIDEIISRIQAKQPLPEPYDDWNHGIIEGCGIAIDIIDEMREELQQNKGEKGYSVIGCGEQ